MRKPNLFAALAIASIVSIPFVSNAEELTTTVGSETAALEWIANNSLDDTKDYNYTIQAIEVSGVTASLTDESGYHITDIYDTAYSSGEVLVITGGMEDIILHPDNFEYSVQPGDSGTITIGITNSSGDTYTVTEANHTNGALYQYDRNGMMAFSYETILNRLNKFDITVKDIWNTDELTVDMNSQNIKTYVTEERLLKYYNDVNNTSFSDLYSAWSHNFYNRCWKLEYSKSFTAIDTNNDEVVITWSIDGLLTDNAYQNCAWGWDDTITLKCSPVTMYQVTLTITDKPEPSTEETETTPEETEPIPDDEEETIPEETEPEETETSSEVTEPDTEESELTPDEEETIPVETEPVEPVEPVETEPSKPEETKPVETPAQPSEPATEEEVIIIDDSPHTGDLTTVLFICSILSFIGAYIFK